MKDITGKELFIDDTVVLPLDLRELRIGKITGFCKDKVFVESNIIEGSFYPTAILKIDDTYKEMVKTTLFKNGESNTFEFSINEVYTNILNELNIQEKDITDEYFEKDTDFISFHYKNIHYEIEPA